MKPSNALLGCIMVYLLTACATPNPRQEAPQADVLGQFEPMIAVYPHHRIDNLMSTIVIVGTGSASNGITASLTQLFKDKTNVKVIERGRLESLFPGEVIEYATGLSSEEARKVSKMLEIDHILFFEVVISPYQQYIDGGRAYGAVNLKIIDIKNRLAIFQCSSQVGAKFADPRQYGRSPIKESAIDPVRTAALALVLHQLKYAIGDTMLGCTFDERSLQVTAVWLDSVAANAGLRVGDVVKTVNKVNVRNADDLERFLRLHPIKQGDKVALEVERDGQMLLKTLTSPVIPKKELPKTPETLKRRK